MWLERDLKLDFADVLIRPKRSKLTSRSQVELQRTFETPNAKKQWTGVPIVAANMDTVATFSMATELARFDMPTALHKHYSARELADFYNNAMTNNIPWDRLVYTVGVLQEDFDKLVEVEKIVQSSHHLAWTGSFPPVVCIDVANGYMEQLVEAVERYRYTNPESIIIAGNVVTGEMTQELILHGADIVKVGIGSGSACTTRSKTGVGYPQLSAVMECADAAHAQQGHVMSDGGCREVGDIAKAFGAGADFVMLGGMLAGHDECGTREFYGMSSREAQEKHNGGVALYRATEGKKIEVPDRGPVENTLQEILGGLRSCCTYVGAKYLKHLPKCTTFVRVGRQKDE